MKNFHKIFFGIILILCFNNEVFGSTLETEPTRAELISEVKTVEPGKSFWVAVRLTMEEGWHTYWKNPGDSGLPAVVTWELPQGCRAGELLWPLPERIESGIVVNFGYENEVWLLTEVQVDTSLRAGEEMTLKTEVRWLVCRDVCVPFEKNLNMTLPVGAQPAQADPRWNGYFAKTRALLPQTARDWTFSAAAQTQSVQLKIVPAWEMAEPPIQGMAFFPEENGMIDYSAAQQFDRIKEGYHLTVARAGIAAKPYLKGLLIVSSGGEKIPILLPEVIIKE
ncbi:MAG: hypothetical protein HYS56_03055 [Candidatus Omnitrophica bacterium]|nr:hypothetical protein [Candidatus Omnitrophota bacterium]